MKWRQVWPIICGLCLVILAPPALHADYSATTSTDSQLLAAIANSLTAGTSGLNFQPVNQSGTVTLGGTAQTLMAANSSRHGCIVQNQSNADVWVNELGATAAAIQPSIWLPAGAVWTCPSGGTSLLAISIYGAATGQAFMAREW